MWKKVFAFFLCCLLVVIPFVQRSYAAVTTITVVTILILTILTAMGITLVVADGTKEAFISDKGDSFMSSKGYSGSFADWISGGTPMDISLKLGTLMVAKAVVDRIKEFIAWLIPDAQSNTNINLGSGAVIPSENYFLSGTVTSSETYTAKFTVTGSYYYPTFGTSLTDGNNTVVYDSYNMIHIQGLYDFSDQFVNSPQIMSGLAATQFTLLFVASNFVSWGKTCPAGIYVGQTVNGSQNLGATSPYSSYPGKILNLDSFSFQEIPASATIGNYDDLSDLTTTTTEGSGGTTIVNNTFYITQSGQALNPSSQDLADIVGALQQALNDLEDRMKVQPMTADAEAATQVEPPYNDFQLGNLDLSQLGALLTTRFPFSIPWDLKRIFDLFVVDPEAPHWEVNLFADSSLTDAGIDGSVSVDLGNFPIIGTVTRWFCIIEFCLFLAAETKKYIWTA